MVDEGTINRHGDVHEAWNHDNSTKFSASSPPQNKTRSPIPACFRVCCHNERQTEQRSFSDKLAQKMSHAQQRGMAEEQRGFLSTCLGGLMTSALLI